ncbi:hypothetical protein ACFQT0_20860 [Hymenobacter humi]|uniref:AsmA-like C-terminal domain-containing protein n=1 Tax=Hymenobacter humi TaxID=1411620 RepID=A0ABW2UBT5_9BACT
MLGPFEVEFSPWHDFPHLTASIHHIALTDTTHRQHVPVLRVGRADLRLKLTSLLWGKTEVTRLVISDVDFRERVDSLGHSWGLRGKRQKGTGTPPTVDLDLDELIVNNFRFSSHNGYSRSAFGAQVRKARLSARLQRGVLRVAGTLEGQLSYLRTRTGTLFEREPVRGWVHYKYTFANRQGLLWDTRATLNGDTIRVSGTHTVDPRQPVGTLLKLRFVGNQPLTDVLHAALPPRLDPILAGATSPSRAHIHYTITGLSGPTVTPRNVLTFSLRGASLRWPDADRRISRWDLRGTYDNGPAHSIKSTVLTLQRCRIYSSAGELNIALTLRDFSRPFLNGRFQGRTELPELAAALAPGHWRARGGIADMDVRLRGLLPPMAGRFDPRPLQKSMTVRGTLTLRDASFLVPLRGADISRLNVTMGLRDSLWHLSNATGVLNDMQFRASAVTTQLYEYLTDQHPTARIVGNFSVEELRVDRLRSLLRPIPRRNSAGFAPTSLPKPGKTPRDKVQPGRHPGQRPDSAGAAARCGPALPAPAAGHRHSHQPGRDRAPRRPAGAAAQPGRPRVGRQRARQRRMAHRPCQPGGPGALPVGRALRHAQLQAVSGPHDAAQTSGRTAHQSQRGSHPSPARIAFGGQWPAQHRH